MGTLNLENIFDFFNITKTTVIGKIENKINCDETINRTVV